MSDTTTSTTVTEATFGRDVIAASHERPVVVDFWAPWCGPCHQLAPALERVATAHADAVDLVKLNIDEAPALARRYGVQGIPAVKAFRDGAVVAEFTGVQPERAIQQFFAGLAPSRADQLVEQARASADDAETERLLREALEGEADHAGAVVALAERLAERGEVDEARSLLAKAPTDPAARRLAASLDLASDSADIDALRASAEDGDATARVALGRALAGAGHHEEAVEELLAAVRVPAVRDDARAALLQLFEVLGDDHDLVRRSRPRLASALF